MIKLSSLIKETTNHLDKHYIDKKIVKDKLIKARILLDFVADHLLAEFAGDDKLENIADKLKKMTNDLDVIIPKITRLLKK